MKQKIGLVFVIACMLLQSNWVTFHAHATGQSPRAFSCTAVTEIPQAECDALAALYNGTNGQG